MHTFFFFLVAFLRGGKKCGETSAYILYPDRLNQADFTNSSHPLHCNSPFQAASHGLEYQWCVGNNDLEKKTYRIYQQIANVCMIIIFEGRKKDTKYIHQQLEKNKQNPAYILYLK